jgi:hypothetical protein
MKAKILSLILSTSILGCGGGSGGSDSSIEGTWKGALLLGGQNCSDGTFIGAGSGTVIGEAQIVVLGSDIVGSVVKVQDNDCMLEGERDSTGFTALPISGCSEALTSIRFTLKSADIADLGYQYDVSKVPVDPGSAPFCVGQNYAELQRE